MLHDGTARSFDDPDWQTGVRADFDAKTAANAARLHHGLILVPLFEIDTAFAERANTHAGAANTPVDPGVTGAAVDLRDTHVDGFARHRGQRFGRTDLHALAAQGTGLFFGIDIGRIHLHTAVALVE